jgi:hypothetical protein
LPQEAARVRTFSIGLNRDSQAAAFTSLTATSAAQDAAAKMFPGIGASQMLRDMGLSGNTRLPDAARRILEQGGGLSGAAKAMEHYKAIQADWMEIGSAGARGDAAPAGEAVHEAGVDSDLADLALLGWLLRLSPSQVKWLGAFLLSLQQVGVQLEASGWVELPEPVSRSLSAALWLVTILAALAENRKAQHWRITVGEDGSAHRRSYAGGRRATLAGMSREVRGAEAVASRAQSFSRLDLDVRPALVNGAVDVVATRDGKPFSVMGLTVRGSRIVEMDILADPERLRRLDLTVLGD